MRIGSTDRRPSQQRSTARTILFTSAGSSDPLRLRTCIWQELTGTGNDTTDCAALTRTGVAMNAFSAQDTRGGDEMERSRETPDHRQPPLGGSLDIHAGFGVVTGRSSDLQALPIKMTGVSTDPSSRFQRKPVVSGCSILLTAAGQFRIRTGFPLNVP